MMMTTVNLPRVGCRRRIRLRLCRFLLGLSLFLLGLSLCRVDLKTQCPLARTSLFHLARTPSQVVLNPFLPVLKTQSHLAQTYLSPLGRISQSLLALTPSQATPFPADLTLFPPTLSPSPPVLKTQFPLARTYPYPLAPSPSPLARKTPSPPARTYPSLPTLKIPSRPTLKTPFLAPLRPSPSPFPSRAQFQRYANLPPFVLEFYADCFAVLVA